MRTWKLLFCAAGAVGLAGCDRALPAPSAAPATTQALAPASAPAPIITAAHFSIDHNDYEFPPAIAMVNTKDDQTVAEVYSNDPPQAAQENYTGNGFCLEMPLEITGDSLAGARWSYVASNQERAESVYGIYLRSQNRVLQPYDARAQITTASSPVQIWIDGTFLLFDAQDDKAPPRIVPVTARISAQLQMKDPLPPAAQTTANQSTEGSR